MENYKKCFAYNKVLDGCMCLNNLYCKKEGKCHFFNDKINMSSIEMDIYKYTDRKKD